MSKLIEKYKTDLVQKYPVIKEVEVKVMRLGSDSYEAKILVSLPGFRYYSSKKGTSPVDSLEKSSKGIHHQLDRLKTRWDKKQKIGLKEYLKAA